MEKRLILIVFMVFNLLHGQNMKDGFELLEGGNFSKARGFFENTLKSYPQNKTARLCYARAVGLDDNPSMALRLLNDLASDFPNDFEIQLNIAEALLWNKSFSQANIAYDKLIKQKPKNFNALMGKANTLSNLGNFNQALVTINKALQINPDQPNALISKKFISLGIAAQSQRTGQLHKAQDQLLALNEVYQNDRDILLNLVNLNIQLDNLNQAGSYLEQLKADKESQYHYLTFKSLLAHLNKNDKLAMTFASEAYEQIINLESQDLKLMVAERYIQALIWNKKIKNAEETLQAVSSEFPFEDRFEILKGILMATDKEPAKARSIYEDILAKNPKSFGARIGLASVLRDLDKSKAALDQLDSLFIYYPNQKDGLLLRESILEPLISYSEGSTTITNDNGGNNSVSYKIEMGASLDSNWQISSSFLNKETSNREGFQAIFQEFKLTLKRRILPNLSASIQLGNSNIETINQDSDILNYNAVLNYTNSNTHFLKVGKSRSVENFNTELLDERLLINSNYLSYGFVPSNKLGIFIQADLSNMSDGNSRHSVFGSVYTTLSKKHGLKTGINYQLLGFKEQRPELYFSPSTFHSAELFVGWTKNLSYSGKKEWYNDLILAAGSQDNRTESSMFAFRVQGKIGYKFSKRFKAEVFGNYTNVASASSAGFILNQLGLRMRLNLGKQPVFGI